MAEGFARARSPEGVEVMSAGIRPAPQVHPVAVEVMSEIGIDISSQRPKAFADLAAEGIDVTVTLCAAAAAECPALLPGQAARVSWELDDPAEAKGDAAAVREVFRRSRDDVRCLVDDLFGRGYLEALARCKGTADLALDSMTEGIIAHDTERRIVFFNSAAEAVTGYSRREALGRDCHNVFPGGFCGGKCSFSGDEAPRFDTIAYPVVITTKSGETREVDMSVRAIMDGEEMKGVLASFRDLTEQREMARRLGEMESFSGIIGRDRKMLEVFELIRSVADVDAPVLIQGESGAGKELVAAAIHNEGPRASRLFVPVNCGALPEGLIESELFGHVRGAFTGAVRDKKGRFELADGGTIFLDEVGDISPAMQVKLLRVLQDGAFERVGDTRTIRADARVISATNKDLKKEIAAGRFREDLYYRLCVVPIALPSLRERCGDIPLLVDHIVGRITSAAGRDKLALSPGALDALLSYAWPGNVRELQNALQFALVKCRGDLIEPSHLPPHIIGSVTGPGAQAVRASAAPSELAHGARGAKLTAEAVEAALRRTGGNKAAAARALGVGRATLYRFLGRNRDATGDA